MKPTGAPPAAAARPLTARPQPPASRPSSGRVAVGGGSVARRPLTARVTRTSQPPLGDDLQADDLLPSRSASSSRFVSDRHVEVDSLLADVRASVVSRSRYSDFYPPPSPFLVRPSASASSASSPRPHVSAELRRLYQIADGTRDRSTRHTSPHRSPHVVHPDVPPLFRVTSSSAASQPPREEQSPSGRTRPTSSGDDTADPYARPSVAHNFTDGTSKSRLAVDAIVGASPPPAESSILPAAAAAAAVKEPDEDDDDLPVDRFGVPIPKQKMRWGEAHQRADLTLEERRAVEAALDQEKQRQKEAADREAEAQAHQSKPMVRESSWTPSTSSRSFGSTVRGMIGMEMSSPPSSRPPTGQRRSPQRRPLHPSRPVSAALSSASSIVDRPSRDRNRLWTKYSSDAAAELQRRQYESIEQKAIDEALHHKVRADQLHDATHSHALQGMKLVSEERLAQMENAAARAEMDEEHISAEVAARIDALSSDDEGSTDEEDHESTDGLRPSISDGGVGRRASERAYDDRRSSSRSGVRLDSSASPIDFHRVGVEVARRLAKSGFRLSQSHLDVMSSLPLLEKVWLASHTRGFGLNESEFVDFLSSASAIHRPTLSVLFEKMDINSDARLSWDNYLSYLSRELACKWRMSAGSGTYIVKQNDAKSGQVQSETATVISQLVLLPRVGGALFPTSTGKVVARCSNDTVQVFDTQTLAYLYHVPLHAPVRLRKKVWSYADSKEVAEPSGKSAGTPHPAARSTPQPEKVLLYDVAPEKLRTSTGVATRMLPNGEQFPTERMDDDDADGHANSEAKEQDTESAVPSGQSADRFSIRHLPKSAGSRPTTASSQTKKPYSSLRDRKLAAYLSALESATSPTVAQPLSCIGQLRASGRPPPAERPASAGGVLHRSVLELAARNHSYSCPLTAMAYLPATKQIYVAAQDRSIHAYGLVRRVFECQDLFYAHEPPTAIEVDTLTPGTFAGMHGQPDRSLVIVGSLHGSLLAYNTKTHARVAALPSLHAGQAVRKTQLFSQVGLVSGGMDGRLSIVDPCTFQLTRFLGRVVDNGSGSSLLAATTTGHASTTHGHNSGIFSFALCPTSRTVISVGYDRELFSWDPYCPTPSWQLPTQNTDLLDVLVNESKNQILVVSRDCKVRVFDTRNFKQLQETLDTEEYFPAGRLSACAFDPQRQELITAANKMSTFTVEPSMSNKAAIASAHATHADEEEKKTDDPTHQPQPQQQPAAALVSSQSLSQKAHVTPIVSILYSWSFHQVVTVGTNESVRVWDLFSGCNPCFEFNTRHRAELTGAALDWNGKRLLTACHHGTVCLWNFNNGELLFEFAQVGGGRLELNKVCLLSTISSSLIATGWSTSVLRWPAPYSAGTASTSAKAASLVVTEQVGHRAQILALTAFSNVILTGDAEGELISWVADSGHKINSIQLPKTSMQHILSTDGVGGGRTSSRQPAAPAITCLEFFLVHDLVSYDSWNRSPPPGASSSSSSSSSFPPAPVGLSHSPPDYRQQHLHSHRVAAFVGTDDGSVYIISPQGLSILHSAVHLMPDTVQAMALIQTVECEPTDQTSEGDQTKTDAPDQTPTAQSDAGTVGEPAAASEQHRRLVTDADDDSSRRPQSARFQSPFAAVKRIEFKAQPPKPTEPRVAANPIPTGDVDFDADGNEIEPASASTPLEGLQPDRKPFTMRAGSRFALTTPMQPAATDELADARSIEEFLEIKKRRTAESASASASASGRPANKPPLVAKQLAHVRGASVAPPLVAPSLPSTASPPRCRRVLLTRLLVSDGMTGSDARLLTLTVAGGTSNAMQRASPAIVDQQVTLTPFKLLYLHGVLDHHRYSNLNDGTTALATIVHPTLAISVFLCASQNGHATMWSSQGEWIAEFGQSPAHGWPIKRPSGASRPDTAATTGVLSSSSAAASVAASPGRQDQRAIVPPPSQSPLESGVDPLDDGWSTGSESEELTAEEKQRLIAMECEALGFAADDSSISAMLASVKKTKLGNEKAKRGLAYGAAFRGLAAPIPLGNTSEMGGGGLATFQPDGPTQPTLPAAAAAAVVGSSRPMSVRLASQKARHQRLVASPRDRYVSSFRISHIAGGSGVVGAASADRPFAQQHPIWIPDTLRPGGLRSALFLNDTRRRQTAPAVSSARDVGPRGSNAPTRDLNFFQLAPREQAERQAAADRRQQALFVDHFLSDPRNLLDDDGQIKDHSVARLALQMSEVDAQTRRRAEHQMREARPTHVRQRSVAAKTQANVFLRLANQNHPQTTGTGTGAPAPSTPSTIQ